MKHLWHCHYVWIRLTFMALMLSACGSMNGCSGCEQTEGIFPAKARLYHAAQIRISAGGFEFLESNLAQVLETALPDGLSVCIPRGEISEIELAYCVRQDCGTADAPEPGCGLNIALGDVSIAPESPSTVRALVAFDALSTTIPVQSTLPILDALGQCDLNLNADGFFIEIPLTLTTPEPDRFLQFEFQDTIKPDLNNIEITAGGENGVAGVICSFGQDLADDAEEWLSSITSGGTDLLREIVIDALEDVLVDDLVTAQTRDLVDTGTCRTCDEMRACPPGSGGVCMDGQCRLPSGDCVRIPLGVEGQFDLGTLLGGITPGLKASIDYLASLGGYAEAENGGLSLGLVSGALSFRNRCVPKVAVPPLAAPARSEVLRGNTTASGEDFHLALGLTKEMTAHFVWAFFNSGAACVQITSETVEQLSAATLAIVLPSLTELARNPDAAVAITVSPQGPPEVIFGENKFEMDDSGTNRLVDPALRIKLPNLWLDLHVFMDDRWVRILSIHVDLDVPIGLEFAPDNSIIPIIGDLSDGIMNVRTDNGDILLDDPEVVATLLPTLAAGLLGDMAGGLIDPITLPEFFGLRLDLSQGAVTSIENGALLALFARFSRAVPIDDDVADVDAEEAAETDAGEYQIRLPATEMFSLPRTDTWKQIEILVDVDASLPSGRDQPLEVSWQVNDGTWSPFQPVGQIKVSHPDFVLQGRHHLAFRARQSGKYRTLDLTPARLEVMIDSVAPTVELLRDGRNRLRAMPSDRLTPTDEIRLDVKSRDGRWTPLGHGIQTISNEDVIAVRATDEAGNQQVYAVSSNQHHLIGRRPAAERAEMAGSGCGCDLQDARPESIGWLSLLLMFYGWRRRWSVRSIAMCLGLCLVVCVVCDDDSNAGRDGEGADAGMGRCAAATDCPSTNYACVDGQCRLVTCQSAASDCDGLSCPDGEATCNDRGVCECISFCASGCSADTYCCLSTESCEPEPDACINLRCSDDERPLRALVAEGDPNVCGDEIFRCECEPLPSVPVGDVGRFSDLVVQDGIAFVSAYADTHGDLVFGRYDVPQRLFTWEWVDGLPDDEVPTGRPSGPRRGIEGAGPNVGQYTALAIAADGTKHIAYYDVDNQALKYALGVPTADKHQWTPMTVDADGDAGRWPSITLDTEGRPSIAYMVANAVGTSQLRFRQATKATPAVPGDWGEALLVHQVPYDSEIDTSKTYPETTGLFTSQARDASGDPLIAWYDRTTGRMYSSRLTGAGFTEPELQAGWGHPVAVRDGDMGANVDVAFDADGNVHFCFQDGLTDSLRYLAPALDRDEWVDDGVRLDVGGRDYAVHVVGEDCNMLFDLGGRPLIVYQDSTDHSLVLRRRNAEGTPELFPWSRRINISGDSDVDTAAFGFFVSAVVQDDQIWMTQYVYRHTEDTPYQVLELVIVQL
ncbi:MAG: hypothetical protein VX589_17380 [Myxococcota bacterium]|nr:hypothetical protein [Myxococcota bacterium]